MKNNDKSEFKNFGGPLESQNVTCTSHLVLMILTSVSETSGSWCYHLGGLKHQKCMPPEWWRREIHNIGISRVTVPLRHWVECFVSSQLDGSCWSRCSKVTAMSLQPFPHPYRIAPLWMSLCCIVEWSYLNQSCLQLPYFQVGSPAWSATA